MLAGDELRQVLALLRLVAVAADLIHAQVGVGAVGQADRRRGAADLLHRDDVGEIAHAGAAVFLFDGDAEQAEVAELAPQVHGKLVAAVDLRRARRDLGGGELLHGVAQHVQQSRPGRSRGPGSARSSWRRRGSWRHPMRSSILAGRPVGGLPSLALPI